MLTPAARLQLSLLKFKMCRPFVRAASAASQGRDVPSRSMAAIKFVIYHGGAAHPIYGDEARESAVGCTARGCWCVEEKVARREELPPLPVAVVALRHPSLGRGSVPELAAAYAPKVRKGAPVALVQEPQNVFLRTELLDEAGASAQVRVALAACYKDSCGGADADSREVPAENILGGWPARAEPLSYPVRLLVRDLEFMWPDLVRFPVVLKREGVPIDEDTGLGSLLRNPKNLQVSVNGVDYDLEHDTIASQAGRSGTKRAQRDITWRLIQGQAFGVGVLLVCWAALELAIARRLVELDVLERYRSAERLRLQQLRDEEEARWNTHVFTGKDASDGKHEVTGQPLPDSPFELGCGPDVLETAWFDDT
eukprot:gnl/TRDRNA2_/TRDRNA2_81619_c0_seq2.p1 gnl/TRDRNA2_/TRDRNA2_81619_c0~~gnl/TRDRNA2_/TRDRNA2_81619_c0_seq2.p1  ORF type:complete len:368 (+),score=52.69 gnl/TRDRNA2_/TRDRNA2_81619_c0_seq2:3-1106(+)